MTPITVSETAVATLCIILGAFLWAYLIGNACAVLSALDADAARENQMMDDLNKAKLRIFLDGKRLGKM